MLNRGKEYRRMVEFLDDCGFIFMTCNALELFAGDGTMRSYEYADLVNNVDLVDTNREKLARFEESLDFANVRRHPVDVVHFMDSIEDLDMWWDLIVIDNPARVYGEKRCEHFDVLEKAVGHLEENTDLSAIVFNVSPNAHRSNRSKHIKRREEYYGVSDGNLQFFQNFYDRMFEGLGKDILDRVFIPRHHRGLGGKNQYWIAVYVFKERYHKDKV